MILETWSNTHPRPQFYRQNYLILNQNWTLNDKPIQLPFPPQSLLSQYHDKVEDYFHYQTTFSLNSSFIEGKRLFLHFGAVDQICHVYLNHQKLGTHKGGYLPFQFEITNHIKETNLLYIEVEDSLSHLYPYGKQKKNNGGMWYTPISGIWQPVWIEATGVQMISNIKITPSLNGVHFDIETEAKEYTLSLHLPTHLYQKTYSSKSIDLIFDKEDICLWTPDHPYLYSFSIETPDDHVDSYFALRTITINSKHQICLNQKPLFLNGVLDQGYFHDGLYLPKTPLGYLEDIQHMKELGFNTLRKHIKIEPDIFYYLCDRYGMLVIQDMVNNGDYHFLFDTALPNIGIKKDLCIKKENKETKKIFIKHSEETLNLLYNHPCIIIYTIFNEGWGQFDADQLYLSLKKKDSTRLFDTTSGWFSHHYSDFESLHIYFKTKELKSTKQRPLFLSECGGYKRLIKHHTFSKKSYGYGKANSEKQLTDMIVHLYEKMIFNSIKNGLCGCIYTQLSDIEDEINGLYTYDRQVCKVDKERLYHLSLKINSIMEKGE